MKYSMKIIVIGIVSILNLFAAINFSLLYFSENSCSFASNPNKTFVGGIVYREKDLEIIKSGNGKFGDIIISNPTNHVDMVRSNGKFGELITGNGLESVIIVPKIRRELDNIFIILGLFMVNFILMTALFIKNISHKRVSVQ